MPTRKRRAAEMEAASSDPSPQPAGNRASAPSGDKDNGLLSQLRNMWEFANLMQYIYTFGKVVKIDDDLDIEVCLSYCGGRGRGLRVSLFSSYDNGLEWMVANACMGECYRP